MVTAQSRSNSTFYTKTLSNGLQALGQHIPGVQSAAAVFWVRTGSRDEQADEMGMSHFLEHMAFRRTAKYTGEEIDRAFQELGADHNAATSKEMTFYWARVLSENLSGAMEILSELTHPSLDAEDFTQERNVILEEIARADDQPAHVLFDTFLNDFYGGHSLSWEVLGTAESITNMSVEQMRQYWQRRYGTKNMLFAIAGQFEWDDVIAQLERLSDGWQRGESGRGPEEAQFTPGLHVHQREKFQQQQLAIGMPTVASNDPRYYAAAVLSVILGDDSGSRLFWALNHSGVAETADADILTFDDTGLLLVHISTEPARALEALEIARSELARVQAFDIEPDELYRAKAKLNSSVVIGGESTNDRVMGLINSWLTRERLETLEEVREQIDAVTLDDLRSLLEAFPVSPGHVITAVGPLSESDLQG